MTSSWSVAVFALAPYSSAVSADTPDVRAENAGPELPAQIDKAIRWFPQDTETIIVAQGPFAVEQPVEDFDSFELDKQLELLPMFLLGEIRDGLMQKRLAGLKVSLAIEGSRHFRGPRGLGMMPFEGCQIVIFDDEAKPGLQAAMKLLMETDPTTIELAGQQVAVSEEEWESDSWTVYFTQPQPGILLSATHEGYLKDVLKRMEGEPPTRALPSHLPEWKHVNTKSRFWAIRHYDKTQAQKDPSSPLGPPAATDEPDADAVGIVFSYSPQVKNVAVVRYLTGAEDAVQIVTNAWHSPSDMLVPKIEQTKPGVVEITATTGESEADASFMFVLIGYLGHAVYI